MAKMKPGQISAKRAYELSDSLKRNSEKLLPYYKSLKADVIKEKNPTNKKIMNIAANDAFNTMISSYEKSDRLKSRADAAMSKANRDYPLSESPNPTFKNQK